MRPNWSSLHSAASVAVAFVARLVRRTAGATRSLTRLAWHALRRLLSPLRSLGAAAVRRAGDVFSGPVTAFVYGPLRVGLFGMRRDVSVLVVLVSPVLALGTASWVGSQVGYQTLTAWVRGTWYGTEPALVVFLGVAALLVLATASAAVNSGLVPTTLLVAGPVFGVGVARYGTTVTYEYGASVVSLPDAVAIAALFAVAFGTPIAVWGFVLGSALRRVTAVLADGAGPLSRVADS